MGLDTQVEYVALDIDDRIVGLVNRFFAHRGMPPLARVHDVLCGSPDDQADVAFLLKTAPCLEQQEDGCVAGLLRNINAPFIVL
ncbi:MAG: hypothetical protein IIB87_01940, partial [Chloroflexi bacterium]|nr:hypothetical protein [Chloroflexota bacterium]